MTLIRTENENDFEGVYRVNYLAFGQANESELIKDIRKTPGYIPELSLIAEDEGAVIGHILFSVIHIEKPDGEKLPILALAPMSILPYYQKKGIGSEMVARGIDEARRLGHRAVVVIGHSKYYPRFGFTEAKSKNLSIRWEVPDEAFMVLELKEGALSGVEGKVEFPQIFDKAM